MKWEEYSPKMIVVNKRKATGNTSIRISSGKDLPTIDSLKFTYASKSDLFPVTNFRKIS